MLLQESMEKQRQLLELNYTLKQEQDPVNEFQQQREKLNYVWIVEKKKLEEVNWTRNAAFVAFGFAYLGGFQYWIQINMCAARARRVQRDVPPA